MSPIKFNGAYFWVGMLLEISLVLAWLLPVVTWRLNFPSPQMASVYIVNTLLLMIVVMVFQCDCVVWTEAEFAFNVVYNSWTELVRWRLIALQLKQFSAQMGYQGWTLITRLISFPTRLPFPSTDFAQALDLSSAVKRRVGLPLGYLMLVCRGTMQNVCHIGKEHL